MTLLERYQRALRARGCAARTIETYTYGLGVYERVVGKRFTVSLDEGVLSSADVWRLLEEKAEEYSPAYLSQLVAAAKSFHKWGNSVELWPLNGIVSIPSPKVPEKLEPPLTPAEVAWLLMNIRTPGQLKLVFLGLWAGCRIGESAAIGPDEWQDDRLVFHGKGYRPREIPLAPALRPYRAEIVFVRTRRQLRHEYEKLRAHSPFVWTPHALRRTFYQGHLDQGTSTDLAEDLMGHKPKKVGLRSYGRFPWRQKVEAQERLRVA